ncbi:MAG: hypothetical protein ABEK50_17210 [bacterium]
MIAHIACEKCDSLVDVKITENPDSLCPQCGYENPLEINQSRQLSTCVQCGEQDFYRQTRINPTFGIGMVAGAFLAFLATVYYLPGQRGFLLGMSILLAAAVADRILRIILPEVVVCYHCKTIYSNVPNLTDFEEHDQEKRADIEMGS